MIKYIAILTLLITHTQLCIAKSQSHSLHLIHGDGNEKKLHWDVKTYIIEKSKNGFKYDLYQTWIALPPLLNLESRREHYTILENTKNSGSPFTESQETSKVLLIEHLSQRLTLNLKKNGSTTQNDNLFLKVSLINFEKKVAIKSSCKKLGLYTESTLKTEGILSIDCKQKQNNIVMNISSPLYLDKLDIPQKNLHILEQNESNLQLLINPNKSNSFSIYNKLKNNEAPLFQISYKRPQSTISQFYTFSRKNTKSKIRNNALKNTSTINKNLGLISIGLYGSKLGTEGEIQLLFKPKKYSGYFSWESMSPFKIFSSENKEKTFLESSILYNQTHPISSASIINYGLGLKGIKLGESQLTNNIITGPEVKIGFSTLLFSNKHYEYSSTLKLVPLSISPNLQGLRLLVEFINFSFIHLEHSTGSLSMKYSYFDLESENQNFTDSKLLIGVNWIW